MFFFFNDTATTEIYTLSLHDALPICGGSAQLIVGEASGGPLMQVSLPLGSNRTTERFVENDPAKKKELQALDEHVKGMMTDRKSTRLNSSHANISYAVFCLKKKHSMS